MGRHFGSRGKRSPRGPAENGAERRVERCEVHILRWAHGGDGVAIPDAGPWAGRVTFVPGAVPGDRVVVEAVEVRERFVRAVVRETLVPSPERRVAPCVVQKRCGGCPWMEGSVEVQQDSRRAIIHGELKKRLGATAPEDIEMRPTPAAFEYRQRLRLRVRSGRLGFNGRQSHDFVAIDDCPIALPTLRQALPDVAAAVRGIAEGRVTMLAGEDGVATWVEPADGKAFHVGQDSVSVNFGGVVQRLVPEAFAQANAAVVAQILADIEMLARDSIDATATTTEKPLAAELFAGSGTLTTALWRAGFEVDAWEVAEAAYPGFVATREAAGLPDDAGHWASCDLLAAGIVTPPPRRPPDLVLLDPPRTGAWPLVPWLQHTPARRILYVACDLAAGLRDVAALVTAGPGGSPARWRLHSVIAYDMFPHTGHQEVLFALDRAGG
jgi:23S rRNA (uracil1939-C5)-methyltransferase